MDIITPKTEALHDFGQIIKLHEMELKELFGKKNEIDSNIFDSTEFVLREVIELYKSIIVLMENNLIQPCLLIARPIVENCINLLYIYQRDTEQRSKNFLRHPGCSLLKDLEEAKEDAPGKNKMIEGLKVLNDQIKRSGENKKYWDGKNFKTMCAELGEEEIYKMWYTRLSKYTHSQYKNRSIRKGPYAQFIDDLLTKKIMLLSLQALKSINEKYNLLEGGMVFKNYPRKGEILIFSISSKKIEEQTSKQIENL